MFSRKRNVEAKAAGWLWAIWVAVGGAADHG